MKKAAIYFKSALAGVLTEDENGYTFLYDSLYLAEKNDPISLTLPLQDKPFESKVLFPFFDGLIPEGWLLDIAQKYWKIDGRDRFSLLLACCKDCIGAVSVVPITNYETSFDVSQLRITNYETSFDVSQLRITE
jgi:serine/threonine-protein kinase HipA